MVNHRRERTTFRIGTINYYCIYRKLHAQLWINHFKYVEMHKIASNYLQKVLLVITSKRFFYNKHRCIESRIEMKIKIFIRIYRIRHNCHIFS